MRKTSNLAPAPEVLDPPEKTGRNVAGQWHHEPVNVEGTIQTAIGHMIDGLQAQWRDSGTTVGYFNDTLFKAHAIEDLLAVLISEMDARGARRPEDE